MSENDVRVFEATLQRCVERHRRTFIVVQLTYGLLVLVFAVSLLQTIAALVAFGVTTLFDADAQMLAASDADAVPWTWIVADRAALWSALAQVVSAFAAFGPMFEASDASPLSLLLSQVRSSVFWFVAVAVCHALKDMSAIVEPQAYVQSMNRVLRNSFGFTYDDDADRLVRRTAAAAAATSGARARPLPRGSPH